MIYAECPPRFMRCARIGVERIPGPQGRFTAKATDSGRMPRAIGMPVPRRAREAGREGPVGRPGAALPVARLRRRALLADMAADGGGGRPERGGGGPGGAPPQGPLRLAGWGARPAEGRARSRAPARAGARLPCARPPSRGPGLPRPRSPDCGDSSTRMGGKGPSVTIARAGETTTILRNPPARRNNSARIRTFP